MMLETRTRGVLAQVEDEIRRLRTSNAIPAATGQSGSLPLIAAGYAYAATLDAGHRARCANQDTTSAVYRQLARLCPWPLTLRSTRYDLLRAAALLVLELDRIDQTVATEA